MKIVEMVCTKDPSDSIVGRRESFIQFEDREEANSYTWCQDRIAEANEYATQTYYEGYWDCYMTEKLGEDVMDEDIYAYIDPNTQLDIRGSYTDADGVQWERI